MRARGLKPSFFKNELLATSDPLYAWVFEGLWCLADRDGRLEDRPRRIHIEINAGRAYEGTESSLTWLAEQGFIVRYEHGNNRYIQVVNFSRHQNPHIKEPKSTIPAPYSNGSDTVPNQSSNGTSTVPASGQHSSSPASSLTPDSGLLTPDCLLRSKTRSGVFPRSKTRSGRARTRRCPVDYEPDRAFALSVLPDLDVETEVSRFRDHEFRDPRSDWAAVWRNWVRTGRDTGRYARKLTHSDPAIQAFLDQGYRFG